MYKWVNEKWSWYTKLPWYWKVLGFAVGLGLVCLLALFVVGRVRLHLASEDTSTAVHNNMVDALREEKVEKEEELTMRIRNLRKEEGIIDEQLAAADENAFKIAEAFRDAKSVEEVREILRGLKW